MWSIRALRRTAVAIAALLPGLAPLNAAAFDAVSVSSVSLRADGSCDSVVNSTFHVLFTGDPDTADFGGEDYIAVYLVDASGAVLGRDNASANAAIGPLTLGAIVGTNLDPAAGAFTIYFVDEASAGFSIGLGATFNLSSLASYSFDPSALDSDCVGGAVGAPTGGGSGATAGGAGSTTVSTQVSRAQNDLTQSNLQRHVARLTSGGGGSSGSPSGGAPTPSPSGGADPVATGGIVTNTIPEDEKEGPEIRDEFSTGPNAGLAALAAHFGAAPQPDERQSLPDRTHATDRAALKALAGRLQFSTAGFDGAVGPVEPLEGVEIGVTLPERRDTNFFLYGSFTAVDSGFVAGADDRRFQGDAIAVTAGADHRVSSGATLGLSVSAVTTELDTAFNNGTYEDWTYAVAPYLVLEPRPWLIVTATAGYSYSDIEQSRDNGAAHGETEAHTALGSLTIEGRAEEFDKLRLRGALSVSGSYKFTSAFTESDGNRVAAQRDVAFALEPEIEIGWREPVGQASAIEPFASVALRWDLGDVTNQDNEAIRLGGGLRLLSPELGLTSEFGGKAEIGRDDYEEYTGYGTLSYGYSPGGDDDLRASLSLSGDTESAGVNLSVSYAPGDFLPNSTVSLSVSDQIEEFDRFAEAGPSLQITFSASF